MLRAALRRQPTAPVLVTRRCLSQSARVFVDSHVLGVLPGCSQDDLKAAYRQRTWQLHPDRKAPSERAAAEQAFKELHAAYLRLSGETQHCWPFATHSQRRQTAEKYYSVFVEFMGVRRREREQTLSHVIRAALCDRLTPTFSSRVAASQ